MSEVSFSTIFSLALRGQPCEVDGLGTVAEPLPVSEWTRHADTDDRAMLALCSGPTLDVGCGPGRLTACLAELGHVVLGIDVVPEAVDQTRDRGAPAIHRDVFSSLPGEGRWGTALLADGNVGIGGDPTRLLRRLREVLDPRGRVVVELAPPGTPHFNGWATLRCGDDVSRPFRWSVVGVDGAEEIVAGAGLAVSQIVQFGERWCAVLEEIS